MIGRPKMTSEWRHVRDFLPKKGVCGKSNHAYILKLEENR